VGYDDRSAFVVLSPQEDSLSHAPLYRTVLPWLLPQVIFLPFQQIWFTVMIFVFMLLLYYRRKEGGDCDICHFDPR